MVADVIDALNNDEHADKGRRGVTGFSVGAVMSYGMACFHANKVRRSRPASGVQAGRYRIRVQIGQTAQSRPLVLPAH